MQANVEAMSSIPPWLQDAQIVYIRKTLGSTPISPQPHNRERNKGLTNLVRTLVNREKL